MVLVFTAVTDAVTVMSSTSALMKCVPLAAKKQSRYLGLTIGLRIVNTRNPAIAEGPRDAGVPVEIW